MYQIKCDDALLYNPLVDDEYMLAEPNVKLTTNAVDSFTFTIYPNHPSINTLQKMSSIVSVEQDGRFLFKGRILDSNETFFKAQKIKCEGLLACTNDTVVPPFAFPDDFTISDEQNVVEVFLSWILEQHNSQASDFQKLYVGRVTVTDPNNYIKRSSEHRMKTWKCLKDKLFNSSIGGKLYVRYGSDGKTYVDYVDEFEYSNTQDIEYGSNLVDFERTVNGADLFTAVLPTGQEGLTIESLPDGDINSTLAKKGVFVYHKQGLEKHGWIVADLDKSTFDDVTIAQNLRSKAVGMFIDDGIQLPTTITIKAVDLHLTDDEIRGVRCHESVRVKSEPHGIDRVYELTDLELPLFSPQDSEITLGESIKTLTDYSQQNKGSSSVDLSGYATKSEVNNIDTKVQIIVNRADSGEFNGKDGIDGKDGVDGKTPVKGVDYFDGVDGSNGRDGIDGVNGKDGKGVKSVIPYYYLSTSDTSQTGDSWNTTPKEYEAGKYYWIKYVTTYTDNTTSQTSPVLAKDATNAAQAKAATDTINSTLIDTDTRLSEQISDIIQQADSIIQRVGSIEADYTTSEELKTEITQTSNNLKISVESLQSTIEKVDDETKKRFEHYETYFRFQSDGLYIGEEHSPIQLHLTGGDNAVIEFLLNGVAVLTIDKNGMVAETNIIRRVIHIGEFTLTDVSERLLTLT